MRRPGTVIPDSEDDTLYSGTSLKNSSPLRQPNTQRPGGSSLSRSRTTHVIQDAEGEDNDDTLDIPNPVSTRTRNRASGNLEVVIPAKKDGSPSDSSRSSLGIHSADGATGFNTPATSVGVATDSDIKKPRVRVNASERASRLRSETLNWGTSQRGTKRSATALSVDEADGERADAALACALQLKEYEEPYPKKRKISAKSARGSKKQELQELRDEDLTASEISDRLSSLSPLTPEEEMFYTDDDSVLNDDGYVSAVEGGTSRRTFDPYAYYDHEEAADEDDLPPTWEEQRKARRVSLHPVGLMETITDFILDASRSEEAGEAAPGLLYHVGYVKGYTHPCPGSSKATRVYYSQAETIPAGRLKLDDGTGANGVSRRSIRG